MSNELHTNEIVNQTYLDVFPAGSVYPVKVALIEGETLFAGVGASCAVKLSGDNVASFHCAFVLDAGNVVVQSCETGGTILFNGQPIAAETRLQDGDEILVGENRIVAIVNDPQFDHVRENAVVSENAGVTEDAVASEPFLESDKSEPETTSVAERFQEDAEPDLAAGVSIECDEYEYTEPAREPGRPEEEDDVDFDDGSSEELELLRSEVEFLQAELTSRDQQLRELSIDPIAAGDDYDPVENEETMRLVVRLEELLDELQNSDQRVKSLENLLRASDEATQAEQEEREQIETWLGDIESRVCQRETELESEIHSLKSRVQSAEKQQNHAERQLESVLSKTDSESHSPGQSTEIVNQLKQKLEQQNRLLESANQNTSELETRIEELEAADNSNELTALEQKLVQMELETSRERAEIARQRAELEIARETLERSENLDAKPGHEPDYRFTAMREHLREIHEEEKMIQLQKRQNSLSGRISRLIGRN